MSNSIHRRMVILPVLVGILAVPKGLGATTDYVELVTQPIATESGLWAVDVPVVAEGSLWDGAWVLVEMTTRPIPVQTFRGSEIRNAAALAGLQIHVIKNEARTAGPHPNPPGLFGDTLRVELDLKDFHPDSIFGYRLPTLVPATVDCMLANARRSASICKYLDLRIRGDKRFAKLSRVYRVTEISEPPQPREINEVNE